MLRVLFNFYANEYVYINILSIKHDMFCSLMNAHSCYAA